MTIAELQQRRAELESELRELVETAENEQRDMTSDENEKFDALYEEDRQIKKKLEQREKLKTVSGDLDELRCGDLLLSDMPAGSAVGDDLDDYSSRAGALVFRDERTGREVRALEPTEALARPNDNFRVGRCLVAQLTGRYELLSESERRAMGSFDKGGGICSTRICPAESSTWHVRPV